MAFFAKNGRAGHARSIVDGQLMAGAEELRFEYPFTTELSVEDPRYLAEMGAFYDASAEQLAARLQAGQTIVAALRGRPVSLRFRHVSLRPARAPPFAAEVVPGVTGMSGCWSRAGLPMTHGDDVLSVLPGDLGRGAPAGTLGTL